MNTKTLTRTLAVALAGMLVTNANAFLGGGDNSALSKKACFGIQDGQQTFGTGDHIGRVALDVGPVYYDEKGKPSIRFGYRPRKPDGCIVRVGINGQLFGGRSAEYCNHKDWRHYRDDMQEASTSATAELRNDQKMREIATYAPFMTSIGVDYREGLTPSSWTMNVFYKKCTNCQTGLQMAMVCI